RQLAVHLLADCVEAAGGPQRQSQDPVGRAIELQRRVGLLERHGADRTPGVRSPEAGPPPPAPACSNPPPRSSSRRDTERPPPAPPKRGGLGRGGPAPRPGPAGGGGSCGCRN